jgi:uncharacterized protein YbjT (DUF2867 family)
LSVVGTEPLLASGFFRAKMAQENLIKASSIPYTIIRATQFFEFVKGIADFSSEDDKVRLPTALIQPMAADDVASAVGRIATGAPVNSIVEIGGPEKFRLDELVRQGLAAHKDPRELSQTQTPATTAWSLARGHSFPAMAHDSARRVSRTGSNIPHFGHMPE